MASIINATTTNGVAVQGDNSGSLQLQTNSGTTAVTIDTSQNVGVGTTSPSQKLDVTGNARLNASSSPVLQLSESGTLRGSITGSSTIGLYFQTFTTTPMRFDTNGLERMRITSDGIAQVNTTASGPTIGVDTKLMVKGGDGVIECYSNSNGANYYGITFKNNNANNSGIQGTVFINSTSVTYSSLSDYRFKENVAPMKGALDKVKLLKPVTYTWKSSGEHGQGFLAHELQEVVPDCVVGEKDAVNEDGSPKGQQVDTSFLVATLTAAIQEQQVQIEELKAEVQALKGVK